jgi:hypothetical protein
MRAVPLSDSVYPYDYREQVIKPADISLAKRIHRIKASALPSWRAWLWLNAPLTTILKWFIST